MNSKTLYDKIWDSHCVKSNENGFDLLYVDRHYIHEVTSPQAFEGLRLSKREPWRSSSNFAVPDHNIPTKDRDKGIAGAGGQAASQGESRYSNAVDNLDYAVGTGSLEFNGSAYLTHPATEKLAFGNGGIPDGNFTIELWVKVTAVNTNQMILDFRTSTSDTGSAYLMIVNNSVRWNVGNVDRITSTGLTANTWTHIAVVRNSGVTSLFVGGTKVTTTYTDNTNYGNLPIKIGANASNAQGLTGNMENLMIKLGITAVDYTGDFTPSSTYDDTDINLKFGFDGEAPIPIIKGEIYAKYEQSIVSTCTADGVELWRDEIMTEGVDLARDEYRECADMIDKNKYWIAEEAVGRMKAQYPDFVIPGDTGTSSEGTRLCLRDTYEYIIPAIVADLRYGGNSHSYICKT